MTDTGTPIPPWLKDPKLDALLDGYAAANVEQERDRPGRAWRSATVVSYDPANARARVQVDGDGDVVTPVQVVGEDLVVNGRCVVAYVPPHGAYVVGGLGPQRWSWYVPDIFLDTTQIGVGNGLATGSYRLRSGIVDVRIRFIWGSATTGGGGAGKPIRFQLPFGAADTSNIGHPMGAAIVLASPSGHGGAGGRGWFPAVIDPGDPGFIRLLRAGIGTIGYNFVASDTPFVWMAADSVQIQGSYEPA